jgi:hypothetical protein
MFLCWGPGLPYFEYKRQQERTAFPVAEEAELAFEPEVTGITFGVANVLVAACTKQ